MGCIQNKLKIVVLQRLYTCTCIAGYRTYTSITRHLWVVFIQAFSFMIVIREFLRRVYKGLNLRHIIRLLFALSIQEISLQRFDRVDHFHVKLYSYFMIKFLITSIIWLVNKNIYLLCWYFFKLNTYIYIVQRR